MAAGYKTGGRKKGTPNMDTKVLSEMLAQKFPGYHPIMALAEIANDSKNEIQLRFQANKEIAKYICPQLKSVDLGLLDEQPKITVNVTRRIINSKDDLEIRTNPITT